MAYTKEQAGTDDWVQVNAGDVTGSMAQLQNNNPALLAVATTKPLTGDRAGIKLSEGDLEEVPFPDMVAGDKVWMRNKTDGKACQVGFYLVGILGGGAG